MSTVVTAISGFDLDYVWKGQLGAESSAGGYYINAAQAGEAPGCWSGAGLRALGLHPGQRVVRAAYDAIYRQRHPATGERLGRRAGGYAKYAEHLRKLLAIEPHATAERVVELERMAAQATRKSPAYTDMTVSFSKSISVMHASIRENARRARLAGDRDAESYWDRQEMRFQNVLQAANAAGLEHLQRWVGTRTGYHGARVDGRDPGRYEPAGLVISSWLQGTSRDGDPQDHIHNQVARMAYTHSDGQWRAVDTMALRAQLGAVQALVSAHVESGLTREFGVRWRARRDGLGNEISGVTQEAMDAYSSRTQTIHASKQAYIDRWTEKFGRTPSRSELKFIMNEVTIGTRRGKEDASIDWDKYAAKWDAAIGGTLAQIVRDVSGLGGDPDGGTDPDGDPSPDGSPGPTQVQMDIAIREALHRVQEKQSTWTRADLMRQLAVCLPVQVHRLAPDEAITALQAAADRALSGVVEQVVCLEAPEWPPVPEYLRRELDGRSVYTRPGVERYATHVQLRREEKLLAAATREGAPRISADDSAGMIGVDASALDAQLHERAGESHAGTPSGLRLDQAAALHHALTSPRVVELIVGPAGSGKTFVAARAAQMWRDAELGDVVGLAPSQAARNVLAEAAGCESYNTAQFLGHLPGKRGARGVMDLTPGTLVMLDEGSMTSLADMTAIVRWAAGHGCKVLITGDHAQLTAVEGGGGMTLLAQHLGHLQLAHPVRFESPWEQDASLRLRSGDTSVLNEYDEHGRIRSGTREEVFDQARQEYVAKYLQGKDVFVMAADHGTVREVNRRIRDDLIHLGKVDAGRSVTLRSGAEASAGDLILVKVNDHDLGVANGDVLHVDAVHGATVKARHYLGRDEVTGEMLFGAKVTYRDAGKSAELGYVHTGHTGQGRTVAEGLPIITGIETREWLYVAMTRGREKNTALVVIPEREQDPAGEWDPREADARPGTRPAPEVAYHERVQRERAGQPDDAGRDLAREDERERLGVLSDVLERPGIELSARDIQQRNLTQADHLAVLYATWRGETQEAATARYEQLLRDNLPAEHQPPAELPGTATWLWRTLRSAEAAGLDADRVVRVAVGMRSLVGAADVVAVVDSRIRDTLGTITPLPQQPWRQPLPEIAMPERREYVEALGRAMDDRKERLGEHAADAQPTWVQHALGPVPDDPIDRLEWTQRASDIASYRELFGYDHPTEPVGPEPSGDAPEKRAAWQAAYKALGPVDGVDLRDAPDGRLWHMRSTYERETGWAPRHVGDELRQVRTSAEDAERTAVRAQAEAEVAPDPEIAKKHEIHAASAKAMREVYLEWEAKYATTQDARREWETATEEQRRLAVAAQSELQRRHPDQQLPKLESAEPARATVEQREALDDVTADRARERDPQTVWPLKDPGVGPRPEAEKQAVLDEFEADETRDVAAREKIAERSTQRVPSEDPEAGDEGLAWPERDAKAREAILQPPPAEIKPAPELVAQAQASAPEAEPSDPDTAG